MDFVTEKPYKVLACAANTGRIPSRETPATRPGFFVFLKYSWTFLLIGILIQVRPRERRRTRIIRSWPGTRPRLHGTAAGALAYFLCFFISSLPSLDEIANFSASSSSPSKK